MWLGESSGCSARTTTSFIRATVGERDLLVSIHPTHGSLADWHPRSHLPVTDGGVRPDGTFVRLPLHDIRNLSIRMRHSVLRV